MLTAQGKKLNVRFMPQKMFYAPEWLVLGVNNICNLHCKMCDVGTKNDATNFAKNLVGTHPMNMPKELFFKVIDQAKRYYPNTKIGYAFTEPLIYPDLEETLDYSNRNGFYTSITTNALNLKQKADDLVKYGLNELFISLDGPEAIHNEIRGHKSSFQRAITGIEKLLTQENRPTISVFCVITEWNIGHLKEFVDYFSNFPLKQLGFMHMNFTPKEIADKHNLIYGNTYPATDSNIDEINVDKMDLVELNREINEIKQTAYPFPISFSPDLKDPVAIERFYFRPEEIIGKRCSDIFTNMMIKSDGSVIPAHGRCYDLEVGNLYKSELNEIWNSSTFKNFRKSIMDAGGLFPACSRCCSAF